VRVILLFAAIFFNVLQATDVEYSQLRAHLTARFKTETYKAIASDFDADPRTVSNFVNGTGKSPKILKKAKDKYPTIFQQ